MTKKINNKIEEPRDINLKIELLEMDLKCKDRLIEIADKYILKLEKALEGVKL